MTTQPDPLDDFLDRARLELNELHVEIDRAVLQLDKADRVEDDRNRRAFAAAVETMMRTASKSLESLLDVYGLTDTDCEPDTDPVAFVRALLADHDAADAPTALVEDLADTFRRDLLEVGPNYATADIEVMTQRAADAWKINRAEHGPRATWTRERGHHVATISTIIEDVTR